MALEPGVIDAQWTCKIAKLESEPLPGKSAAQVEVTTENPLTVGETFQLSCEGGSVDLDRARLSLELPPEAKYSLRILQTLDMKSGGAQFLATTWVGAPVEFKHLYLTDGSKRVDLGPLKIEAKSVIPEEKAKEAKPFDPFSPVHLNLPVFVWIVLTAAVGFIALWVAWVIVGVVKRKKLKSLLAKNAITLSPFHFFHKDLRRLARQGVSDSNAYIKELNEAFRWYLTRTFFVNALLAKPKTIVRAIQKSDPSTFKAVRRDLTLALTELEKALAETQTLNESDIHQLTELCRSLADRINLEREA